MEQENRRAKGRRKRKVLRVSLLVLLALLFVLGIVVGVNASKNKKAMNACVDAVLEELEKSFTVTPRDVGEFKNLKVYGIMKFRVEQYDIEELGNLSVMRVNMGIMQMATIVITPKDKNLPLLSADYMYLLSNRKSYLEFYDLVKEKDEAYHRLLTSLADVTDDYTQLEDFEASSAWYEELLTVDVYKSGKPKDDAALKQLLTDSLHVYLEHAKEFPLLSKEERKEKLAITQEYTDGLIEKGGVSTDVFKKELGEEKTKNFFDKVFFGTTAEEKGR